MTEADEYEEEQLVEYAAQLSLQEAFEASYPASSAERSIGTSTVNRKVVDAIKQAEVFELQQLSEYAFAFTEADEGGRLPIHEAAVQPVLQILEIVLDASPKAVWEQKTYSGQTPLTMAANAQLAQNVRIMLEYGMRPKTMNDDRETPLLIASRIGSYEMIASLIEYGACISQPCAKRWTALHEAAKQGRSDIINLLLKTGESVNLRDGYGVTPLGVAAEYGQTDALELLIHKGGNIYDTEDDGSSVLYAAAAGGNPDCVHVLLEYGAGANVPNNMGHLPIHRAAFEGHYLALKYLTPVTSKGAIQRSGLSPVHSAAEGQSVQCLEYLLENDFSANTLLADHISESYDDERRTALFFAVCNQDILCTELLLRAGANPNLDPLNVLLVAVRARNHEIVRMLLSFGANVNCYFTIVNETHFPTAIQYALKDEMMLRLLLNNGYKAEMCFDCLHGDIFGNSFSWPEGVKDIVPGWTSAIIKDNPFCDFIAVSWMRHLAGHVVCVLLDYVDFVPLCVKLQHILETQKEWTEIKAILENPRSLKHLCRLKIRKCMGLERLQHQIEKLPFPTFLKEYILYRDYDLYGRGLNFAQY
ncbi:ankyrin repeat and SOCS box protein 15 [Protopterus annectens]|uniref:ankyrin repeat and SOCS box protein 15 n=1 Tax=Protopterus annectens TaxID=7888 RepID=UPI001CFA6D43|nr:ankyrin repeat and SOCS box protein 15 [Protopterus annectens]XP_043944706.1 ankyrin repeat and SOCS box protein 15 [Protopterus annectens]XP_043944707.1 ankyrin repeat and SOCS box protein 15 [Protopterus annectens]XP_043944708.1 ankyrin repeat and SOCS box protein 15 [Protopterus annectens]XP_043944709.1 ankyrin repeat and SOCS box protein 15 [Protopterus annectens]